MMPLYDVPNGDKAMVIYASVRLRLSLIRAVWHIDRAMMNMLLTKSNTHYQHIW
jgi:RecA/RadA recombinase